MRVAMPTPVRLSSLAQFPWLRHGITTRDASMPLGGDMSISTGRDNPDAVIANRVAWLATTGSGLDDTVMPGLIHGTHVTVVTQADAGRGARTPVSIVADTDAMLTDTTGLTLCMCFADCVPLIVIDPVRRVIGLGHAGWRGTLAGMATAMVHAMSASFGSHPADLHAVIGPSIGPAVYIVGEEVAAQFVAAFPGAALVVRSDDGSDRSRLDLWEANRHQFRLAGLADVQITTSSICTLTQGAQFFSHRYAIAQGEREGRFAVMLRIGEH